MAFSLKTTYLRRIPRPPANKTIEFSRESTLGGCSPVQVNSEVPGQFPQPPQASKQNLQIRMLLVAQTTVTPCRMKTKQNRNEGTHHHPSIYHPVRETPGKNGWQGSPVPTCSNYLRPTEGTDQGTQSSNLDLAPTSDLPTSCKWWFCPLQPQRRSWNIGNTSGVQNVFGQWIIACQRKIHWKQFTMFPLFHPKMSLRHN